MWSVCSAAAVAGPNESPNVISGNQAASQPAASARPAKSMVSAERARDRCQPRGGDYAVRIPRVEAGSVRREAPAMIEIPVVPLRDVARWAIFVAALLFVLLYLVGLEEGATSIISSRYLHEFLHDGRHLLGFPCH